MCGRYFMDSGDMPQGFPGKEIEYEKGVYTANFVFDATKQFYAQLKEASAVFVDVFSILGSRVISDFGDNKQTDQLKEWMADFWIANRA